MTSASNAIEKRSLKAEMRTLSTTFLSTPSITLFAQWGLMGCTQCGTKTPKQDTKCASQVISQ